MTPSVAAILLPSLAIVVSSANAAPPSRAVAPPVEVRLEVETTAAPAAGPIRLGVRFVLEPGWHVYWKHPGDSGLAPAATWTLPPGFVAGEIAWPAPRRIPYGPLANYGYEGEVLLPVTLEGPRREPGSVLQVGVRVGWLVCREDCFPGSATLGLALPVSADPPALSPAAPAFAAARARIPRAADALGIGAFAEEDDAHVVLRLSGRPGQALPAGRVEFFAAEGGVIAHAAPQAVTRAADGGIALVLVRAGDRRTPLERLRGVVVAEEGWAGAGAVPAITVDAPVRLAGGSTDAGGAPAPPGFLVALLLAGVGGVLLNLMPCVFPVLAIKVLDLLRHVEGDPRAVRRHALAYTAGVLVSMWALVALLVGLRAAGMQLGWGFQLQSPAFVLAVSALLLALALSLFGVFDLGIGLAATAGRMAARERPGSGWLGGALAVAVATPCTAPFMGTALAYALTLRALPTLAVFTALGLGLALPYVVLCLYPAWLRWLPRPGYWLVVTKQVLAFPLLGAAAWLVWVVAQQRGADGVLAALGTLLAVGLAAWLAGQAEGLAHARARRLLRASALGIATVALVAGLVATERVAGAAGGPVIADGWLPYSAAELARQRAAGRPVFVDFTAAWCITCKVNERLVLDTEAVRSRFAARGVVLLRADWTNRSPEIAAALREHGRASVPLYVLYRPGRTTPPKILPTVLTPKIVLEALDRLPNRKEEQS